MTVVLPDQVTSSRRLVTLAVMRLIGRPCMSREVVAVLKLLYEDGLWPVPDRRVNGNTYFVKDLPYECGTRQHMEQMAACGWLKWHREPRFADTFAVCAGPPTETLAVRYLGALQDAQPRPEALDENGAPARRCVICRRQFRSEQWTCGDPVCHELLELPAELMARRSRLESEGLDAVFDVDIRTQMRFVTVRTARGEWRTNALKSETWEQLLDRVLRG